MKYFVNVSFPSYYNINLQILLNYDHVDMGRHQIGFFVEKNVNVNKYVTDDS